MAVDMTVYICVCVVVCVCRNERPRKRIVADTHDNKALQYYTTIIAIVFLCYINIRTVISWQLFRRHEECWQS